MKEKILKLWQFKKFKMTIRAFLAFFTLSLLILILKWPSLPPEVPLYYSFPWGEEQIATPFELLILPLFSFLIFILNFFLASMFLEKEPWLTRILILTSTIFSFLSMLTLIKIIFLIT